MALNKTEGIVVKSFPIKESDRILTLMTKEMGLIKLYCKASKKKDYFTPALCSPFTKGEFVFTLQEGDLGFFREGMVFNQHLALHDNYDFLMTAHKLGDALLRSQPFCKPSPLLYLFFSLCLEKIPSVPSSILISTFFLKLLKYEGFLQFERHCSTCGDKLKDCYRYAGEVFCNKESPLGSQVFSPDDEDTLLLLAAAPTFSSVSTLPVSLDFHAKIMCLFDQFVDSTN